MGEQIKGLKQLQRKFKQIGKGGKSAVKKAIRAGTTVMAKAQRAAAPVDEGALKKAQTSKVGGKGGRAFGVIGADRDKLEADAAADSSRPTNIDWLVEFGHVAPNGVFVPPSGKFRATAEATMPAAQRAIESKLISEIERELTR